MAKRVVTTTKTFSDADEPAEIVPKEAPPDVQQETWSAFRGKFAANKGAKAKLYRQTPKGRQYCMSDSPSLIDEEAIRRFHTKQPFAAEAGEYEVALEVDGVLIGDPFPVYISPQVPMSPGDIQTPGQPYGGMAEMFRLSMERMERLEERMLMQRNQTPMVEMVQALASLDQLRGGGGSSSPLNNVETLLKCIEIGQGMGPNANKEWWQYLIEAVKDNGPMLQMIAARMMTQGQPQGQQPPAPVQVSAPQEVRRGSDGQVEQQPTEEQVRQMKAAEELMLKGAIAFLKKKAIQQSDPELYVAMVCDNQDEPAYAKLISEIVDKDFSAFATIDPDIEKPQYRGFFCAIYDGLRSEFGPKNKVESISSRKNGNTRNASENGGTGAKRG